MTFSQEAFMQQLMATFAAEAQEHLHLLSQGLLRLETETDAAATEALLAEMFRAAHSLKGAARAVGAATAGDLAHALESVMGVMRTGGGLQPDAAQFDLLYQTVDALGALTSALVSGEPPTIDTASLIDRLETLSASPRSAIATPPTALPQQPQTITPPAAPVAPSQPFSPPSNAETAPVSVHDATGQPSPPQPTSSVQPAGAPAAAPINTTIDESVRVATVKLDALIEQVGELRVAQLTSASHLRRLQSLLEEAEQCAALQRQRATRWRADAGVEHLEEHFTRPLTALLGDMQRLLAEMQANRRQQAQLVDELEERALRTRLMPVSVVLESFPRMVRDLARDLGKSVRLTIEGGDTEVDRAVLEHVKAPLTHLLRNAIDHGIEMPAARQAAGKPAEGHIRLSAAQRGSSIVIEVGDDGAGIDVERVRASAIQRGVLDAAEAERMNTHDLMWLIFRSGMSTRTAVTDVSGRGVGLDVVRDQVERLRGYIDLVSTPGQGTRFTLHLPLSVATTLSLLIQSASQLFAIPVSGVLRVTRIQSNTIGRAEGRDVVRIGDRLLALHDLADLLALSLPAGKAPGDNVIYALLLGVADQRVAIAVDAVLEVQELVVKPLPQPFDTIPCIAGASNLGTGEIALVLNVADLARAAGQGARQSGLRAQPTPAPAAAGKTDAPNVLVVDDSFTTRSLERNILETAGYHVHVAADGLEAWTVLQSEPIDLVVSDVMMPRMTGFELTARIRGDKRFANLPVVLVTAQDSAEDRERGLSAGADAYLVKSAFDQDNLLDTVARLL